MRIFLRFGENGKTVSDPSAFDLPPTIRRFYPNFLILEYSPLKNIDVSTEYWVPQSNAVSCRVTISNKTSANSQNSPGGLLSSYADLGSGHDSDANANGPCAGGANRRLFPVLFFDWGPAPGSGPHPSLFLDLDLGPGATRTLTWAQAATMRCNPRLTWRGRPRPVHGKQNGPGLNCSIARPLTSGRATKIGMRRSHSVKARHSDCFSHRIHICPVHPMSGYAALITDIRPKGMAQIIPFRGMVKLRSMPIIFPVCCLSLKPHRICWKTSLLFKPKVVLSTENRVGRSTRPL